MDGNRQYARLRICLRAFAVWLIIIAAEIVHGILRAIVLVPWVGEFRSNQIGVFTGSAIILAIAYVSIRWIGASRRPELLLVGTTWLVLDRGVRSAVRAIRDGLAMGAFARGLQHARRWTDATGTCGAVALAVDRLEVASALTNARKGTGLSNHGRGTSPREP